MSFEPLKLKLIDRSGQQVTESVQTTEIRAFERAVTIPDANIKDLISGAARVARVIADGRAEKPEEYASTILRRIAWRSQRDFLARSQIPILLELDKLRRTEYPNPERVGCPKAITFEALRHREIKFDDPVWAHIEQCSPC